MLTNDGEAGDGPVTADVVLVRAGVIVEVAVLEGGEGVGLAVQAGAVVGAVIAVVAAVALVHPPPVVLAAPVVVLQNEFKIKHFFR